jgi:hypothetical protein
VAACGRGNTVRVATPRYQVLSSALLRLVNRSTFNEMDEIADRLDPINDVVANFDPEPVFDQHHQFESIKPVSPKVFEVCFIRDSFGMYAQVLDNEIADLAGNVCVYGLCFERQATDTHGDSPNRATQLAEHNTQIGPSAWLSRKILEALHQRHSHVRRANFVICVCAGPGA